MIVYCRFYTAAASPILGCQWIDDRLLSILQTCCKPNWGCQWIDNRLLSITERTSFFIVIDSELGQTLKFITDSSTLLPMTDLRGNHFWVQKKIEKRRVVGMKHHPKFKSKQMFAIFACTALIILSFVALRLSPIVRYPFLRSRPFAYSFAKINAFRSTRSMQVAEKRTLQHVLRQAAMPDKTVIITTLNQAWAAENTMIDLFLESFHHGEGTKRFLNHLVIVALDQKAYDRCVSIHIHCYMLRTDGDDFSGEKYFMTPDYLKLMWKRIDFLRGVLEQGYNFLFTDADIMWLRDPFLHLSPAADFQIACDHFTGYPSSLQNRANGGFTYARSNKRTIEFYKYWYKSREIHPDKHDQDVLNEIKYDEALADMGLRIRFLDTTYYAGFCEGGHDMEKICTMHANCCLGLDTKLQDLRLVLSEWMVFKSMTPQMRRLYNVSWSAPKECVLNWPY